MALNSGQMSTSVLDSFRPTHFISGNVIVRYECKRTTSMAVDLNGNIRPRTWKEYTDAVVIMESFVSPNSEKIKEDVLLLSYS